MKTLIAILTLLSFSADAGPVWIWNGTVAKNLLGGMSLNDSTYILTGSADPTSVAQNAPAGSLYLRTNGSTYAKQDAGSSTNWTAFAAGSGITALTGDVTASGTGSVAATVALVNGSTAANVHAAELLANAATSANTASAIAKRDANGLIQAQVQPAINAQTGTTYTLLAADNGKVITLNNASAITLTVPSGLGAGFSALVVQLGAGQATFTASSTTLNNRQSFTKTAGQYATASIVCYVANTCVTGGDMQ